MMIVLILGGDFVRWYWSAYSFPELARFSRDQQRKIVKRCKQKMYRRHGIFQSALILVNFAALVLIILFSFKDRLGFVETVGLILIIAIFNQIELHNLRDLIKTDLPGYCGFCGYDLTGNASSVCPECGTSTLTPVEEPPPHPLLRWIRRAGMVGLYAFTVFALAVLIAVASFVIRNLVG